MSENNQDSNERNDEIKALWTRTSKILDYFNVPEQECEIFVNEFFTPLEKAKKKEDKDFWNILLDMCIGGLGVGLMPSDCYQSLVKIGSIQTQKTSGQNKNQGEGYFWWACAYLSFILPDKIGYLSHDDMPYSINNNVIHFLNKALEDPLLPRKMFVIALQVKITCYVSQAEYDKARIELVSLEEYLQLPVSKRKTISYMGYVSALRDYDMHVELDRLIQIDIPKEESEEALSAAKETGLSTVKGQVSVDASMLLFKGIELFSEKNRELFEQVFEQMAISKREILAAVSPSHEKVRIDLTSNYGSWVNELSNQGALVNAEFLYDALNKRTWGGVVTEYSSAVEAEIKNKLIEPFIRFLISRHGQNILVVKSIPPFKVRYDISLFDIESLFTISETESVDLRDFLSTFSSETHLFIVNELPKALKQIRELRNPPSHGVVVNSAQSTKTIRSLILGESPQKPGILKKLAEIKKVS